MQLFCLARILGTSVSQVDAIYGHPMPHSEEYLRGLLDAFRRAETDAANKCSDDARRPVRKDAFTQVGRETWMGTEWPYDEPMQVRGAPKAFGDFTRKDLETAAREPETTGWRVAKSATHLLALDEHMQALGKTTVKQLGELEAAYWAGRLGLSPPR